MAKRKVPEINSTSTADIAFMLLIFFIVSTTMSVDSGITRKLPPIVKDQKPEDDIKVKERNVLIVLLNRNANGKVLATNNPGSIRVANFTNDETESQYIAARYLFGDTRRSNPGEKFIKVGKVTSILASNVTINIEIEDKDVY